MPLRRGSRELTLGFTLAAFVGNIPSSIAFASNLEQWCQILRLGLVFNGGQLKNLWDVIQHAFSMFWISLPLSNPKEWLTRISSPFKMQTSFESGSGKSCNNETCRHANEKHVRFTSFRLAKCLSLRFTFWRSSPRWCKNAGIRLPQFDWNTSQVEHCIGKTKIRSDIK